jgi:hypothetical protein
MTLNALWGVKYGGCPASNATIFFSFTIYFIKTSNVSRCYLNLWLPKPIFQHSLLLNLWPYATKM